MSILATTRDRKGKTRKNKRVMAGTCIFPFKYKRNIYEECIEEDEERICATEVNPKTQTMTKYGYCESQMIPVINTKKSTEKTGTEKKAPSKSERVSQWMKELKQSTLKKKSSSPKKTIKRRQRKVKLIVKSRSSSNSRKLKDTYPI